MNLLNFIGIIKDTFDKFLPMMIDALVKLKHQNDLIKEMTVAAVANSETQKEADDLQKQLRPALNGLYLKLLRKDSDVQEVLDDFNNQAKPILREKYYQTDKNCDILCLQFDEIIIDYFKHFYPERFVEFKLEKIEEALNASNKNDEIWLKEYRQVYDCERYHHS